MSQDTPTPAAGETITPQEAWTKLCAIYLKGVRENLKHSVVCPEHSVTMQFSTNKRGRNRFRVVCTKCGAQAQVPSEPDWANAWKLTETPKIQLLG